MRHETEVCGMGMCGNGGEGGIVLCMFILCVYCAFALLNLGARTLPTSPLAFIY
jgi:hypothetical protein